MRALLVDDSPTSANLLRSALDSENFLIEQVESGEEALDVVKLYDFDVMMLEMDLPDMDGSHLVRRMRAADINLPVMVLSGQDCKQAKIDVLNAGADDFLTKPFDSEELIVRLKAMIRRSKGHAGSVIRIGRMAIDLGSRTVEIDDKPLHVTAKEYSILELLALRRGMTLTKETFLDHLYGGMDEPEQKIIDVFICKLRKKIAAVSGHQTAIRTIWGRGYVLEEAETSATGLAEDPRPFSGHPGSVDQAQDRWINELDLLMLDLFRTVP
ncbi:MAG: response regulator transcription factor [Geminicoccaceae bacterium]